MKIVVCVTAFPYPPRGGGYADAWRRIEAFVRLGHQVMMVNPYDPDGRRVPTAEELAYTETVLWGRYSFSIKRNPRRTIAQLLNMRRLPWFAATRVPEPDEQAELDRIVRDFGPDLIWLDGPWLGEVGLRLHRKFGAPIAYRSHNVEHVYLKVQAAAAVSRRNQIAWRLACVGVKQYQLRVMAEASAVFDISLSDLEYWRGQGVINGHWLPPLPELALAAPSEERVVTDILFVGGLRTPNNVQGVRWLVHRVLPILQQHRPDVVVGVVGSYPDPDLVAELAAERSVRTFYDVPDVTPYQFGARVLVNPVAVGSGIQLKMIDMLMTDAPIVTRSQGTSGFPASCIDQFEVADSESDFAAALLRCLDEPGVDPVARAEVRSQFDVNAVRAALATIPLAE